MRVIGDRPALGLSSVLTSDSSRDAIQLVLRGNSWNDSASTHYMPPFADVFDDDQIADVLAYLRIQYAQRPLWEDVSQTTAAIRKETLQP
jgi:mono/diheme cytochrome c family protein